jgi:glycosyltransferase involved in cell wall biosynthesis
MKLLAIWRSVAPLDARTVVQRTAGISTGLVGAVARGRCRRFVYSSANIVDFEFEKLTRSAAELHLFHFGLRLADRIVVQTEEQAAACRERFGRTAIVVRSIAEPAPLRGGSREAFLWVGRLVSYKRPRAYLELARAMPDARFRMIGLPSEKNPEVARAIAREAEDLPNLELLSPRPRRELLKLYDSAVAVVNTSDYEGISNIILEAWARGVPALALTHDPDGVIARHGLGGFAAGSPRRLAELAQQMWAERDHQEAVAARCRDYARLEHSLDAAVHGWTLALGLEPRQGEQSAGRHDGVGSLPVDGPQGSRQIRAKRP